MLFMVNFTEDCSLVEETVLHDGKNMLMTLNTNDFIYLFVR